MWLLLTIDVSAVIALIMILAWQPEVGGRSLLRLLVVLWGTTAFGLVHGIVQWGGHDQYLQRRQLGRLLAPAI